MIVVRFSNVDEFLDELDVDVVAAALGERGAGEVDRRTLRVTKETRPTQLGLVELAVVAGYTLPLSNGRTQLTEFRHIVGALFPNVPLERRPESEIKMIGMADELVAKIEAHARQLGLDVRAGFYPPSSKETR